MMRLARSVAVVGAAIALTLSWGSAPGVGAKRTVSPCGRPTAPTWSPDGTQIAWYGFRWPLPSNHHAVGSSNILRAICISDADGKHLHALADTVCSAHCPTAFADPPDRLEWVTPTLLLSGNDLGIFAIPVAGKPALISKTGPVPFSTDASGHRVASGMNDCSACAGPVTIRSVPSAALVGTVGGTTLDNGQPSLSPDGTQVVFTRGSANGPSIWIAAADGGHVRRLERRGNNPLWSPAGDRIAYLGPTGAWRLVSPQGSAGAALLANGGPGTVFGWSPNGRSIAFPDATGSLAVIDVATRKVRRLLKLQLPYDASSVAWSPNSQQLLVVWRPPGHSSCPSGLWRIPIDRGAPRLVHGC